MEDEDGGKWKGKGRGTYFVVLLMSFFDESLFLLIASVTQVGHLNAHKTLSKIYSSTFVDLFLN